MQLLTEAYIQALPLRGCAPHQPRRSPSILGQGDEGGRAVESALQLRFAVPAMTPRSLMPIACTDEVEGATSLRSTWCLRNDNGVSAGALFGLPDDVAILVDSERARAGITGMSPRS